MTGVQAPHPFEALFTALSVEPHSRQIRRSQTLPQTHVGAADGGKLLECVVDVGVAVAKATGSEILIVAGQRRPIVGQHHPKPEAAHEI